MKVSDLAAELEVTTSVILELCQRFGIDASWAGAELTSADVATLRAELVSGADPTHEPAPEAKPPAMPPTAVGSMPDLIDEVTPEPEPDLDATGQGQARLPGGIAAGGVPGGESGATAADQPRARGPKRFDRAARNSVLWLLAAVGMFAVSNLVDNAFAVLAIWIAVIVALGFTLFDANRGRRHAQVHSDRVRGLWVSVIVLVLGVGASIGMALAIYTAVREEPAADAPLSIGELASVDTMRWGYTRLTTVADNGWRSPAKPVGTCWVYDEERGPRDPQRVENTQVKVTCERTHTFESVHVFTVRPETDAPYPDNAGDFFSEAAQEECADDIEEVLNPKEGDSFSGTLVVEYPTKEGWESGDHDVTCGVGTEPIRQSLTD